ncbi:MAG: sulfate transporter [Sorangiineae bacterium NIC37A_2]|jgi:MFS superfamily sulfate permease-like transporter|nr:MAG: sulfate transporter [Sorangiineae bacterium NIC37A_2]
MFKTLSKDFPAGSVTFLVALPLCLGIALASGAPLFSGLLAGIVGGVVVGALSGSHTSVSGPAAGLTAIVATQIATLGSFRAFLAATVIAGVFQLVLGLVRAGFIAHFFPSAVVKGLLAAIGVILILKQVPHVIGHDPDPIGDMAFEQADRENTFTEVLASFFDVQYTALIIGLVSIGLLLVWDKVALLKRTKIPAPLAVVAIGVLLTKALSSLGGPFELATSHLVQVPVLEDKSAFFELLTTPDFSALANGATYMAAVTLAIVASLETLLNLEAVDALDPKQRRSPASRELVAQGIGNMTSGLLGGLPVTSVVVRGSVNVGAGAETKMSAIIHGILLLLCVLFLPTLLNTIPLSALAAILVVTGFKLASPSLFVSMARGGKAQLLPFLATVAAIVLTDMLKGIVIGLVISITFILYSNSRRPVRRLVEKRAGYELVRIEFVEQVSFLGRSVLERALDEVPRGSHVLLDARSADYIDPDILTYLSDFVHHHAPAHDLKVSMVGLERYRSDLADVILFQEHVTRGVQRTMNPAQVLELLKQGNERFLRGENFRHDAARQIAGTAAAQSPLAVVVGCIDSRAPAEILFDASIGDIFSVRVAGNVAREKVMGSVEYACAAAGAKLVVIMGHTRCGAVTAAVEDLGETTSVGTKLGCKHIDVLVDEIQKSIDDDLALQIQGEDRAQFVDQVARRNVNRTMDNLVTKSPKLKELMDQGKIAIVCAMYDVASGTVEFGELNEHLPVADVPHTFQAQAS